MNELDRSYAYVNAVSWITSTRDPLLVRVNDNLIAFLLDGTRNVLCVGRRDALFCHGERRSDLALEKRFKPLLLLFWCLRVKQSVG